MGIFALGAGMTGCRPASVGLGPLPATAPAHPAGLRYSLGRDLLAVEAVVSDYIETRIVPAEGKRLREETVAGIVPVKLEISITTTADPNFVYFLDFGARRPGDGSLEVRVGDNGLLSSFEAESKSRAGEVLVQLARLAGEVAGAAAGWRGSEALDAGSLPGEPSGPAAKDDRPGAAGRRERRLESLSREALFFLQESPAARELWREVDRLEEELVERRAGLREHTDSAAGAADTARFSLSEKRADFVEKSIQFLEKQADKARAAFFSALDGFAAAEALGRMNRDRTVRFHLNIPDLPPASAVSGALSDQDVVSALEKDYSGALDVYRETGLVVAFDPALPLPEKTVTPPETKPGKNEIRIYFREAVAGFLRIYAWRERIDPEAKEFVRTFGRVEEKSVTVLHPALPVRYVSFNRKAFSSRTMRLAVNGQGRVVGLTTSSASSSAAAVEGVASALAALRDALSDAWKDVRGLVEALGLLSLDDFESHASLLKLQAEKLKKFLETDEAPGRKIPGA